MPLRRFMFAAFGLVFALASVSGMRGEDPEDASAGMPEVRPKFVEFNNTVTEVTVIVRLTDKDNVIPGSVVLQQVDKNDNVIDPNLGVLSDDGPGSDGKGPDLKKGDGVYTIRRVLTVSEKDKVIYLRVIAKWNGMKSLVSKKMPLTGVASFLPEVPDPITDIEKLLKSGPDAPTNVAEFIQRLNPKFGFKQDWIMITNTRSAQKADAEHPRLILANKGKPGSGATAVFGVQGVDDADKDIVEYIQWVDKENKSCKDPKDCKFQFHKIDIKAKKVTPNDTTCYGCHAAPGATKGWPYPRPNWDAYDSWGGALPFNRDRIYINKADPNKPKVEQKAMQRLLQTLATDNLYKQLDLPENISRNDDGTVFIDSDPVKDLDPVKDKTQLTIGKDAPTNAGITFTYKAEGTGKDLKITFPGDKEAKVNQGGDYLTMHHHNGTDSTNMIEDLKSDEGRGVGLFDNFTNLNAKRIAQEVKNKFKEEQKAPPVDIRPVALAIANGCTIDPEKFEYAPEDATKLLKAKLNIAKFNDLIAKTEGLQQPLPQTKANQQAINLRDIIKANDGLGGITADNIVAGIAQRSVYGQPGIQDPADGKFNLDALTGFMIDREDYSADRTIALFRFFLEPSHEPVNKWSLSLRSRSNTYTFADVFAVYLAAMKDVLGKDTFGGFGLGDDDLGSKKSCEQLKKDSFAWFQQAMKTNQDYFK